MGNGELKGGEEAGKVAPSRKAHGVKLTDGERGWHMRTQAITTITVYSVLLTRLFADMTYSTRIY